MSLTEGNCFCEVLEEPLDILQYTKLVSDPGAGAIASFTGVTRDTFQGKAVEKLEYEAYVPMALKKLLVGRALPLEGALGPGHCWRPVSHTHEPYRLAMLLAPVQEICRTACDRWNLKKVAVAHRTGTVHIGEASVIIVASSPHRRDALEVRPQLVRQPEQCSLLPAAHGSLQVR